MFSLDYNFWSKCWRSVSCTTLFYCRHAIIFSSSYCSKCSCYYSIQVVQEIVSKSQFFVKKIFRTYAEYVTPGVLLSEELKCTYGDVACLRNATYQEIIAAQIIVNNKLTSLNLLIFFEPWTPVVDNIIVHGQLTEIGKNPSFPLKPFMIGTVTEDALLFIHEGWRNPVSQTQYAEIATSISW